MWQICCTEHALSVGLRSTVLNCFPLPELMKRCHSRSFEVFRMRLASRKLSVQDYALLCVASERSVNQKNMARLIGTSEYTVSQMRRRLEDRNLIKKLRDSSGGLGNYIELTSDGRQEFERATQLVDQARDELFKEFTDSEKKTFVSVLSRFARVDAV